MTNHLFRKCIVSREWWEISEKERWNLMIVVYSSFDFYLKKCGHYFLGKR